MVHGSCDLAGAFLCLREPQHSAPGPKRPWADSRAKGKEVAPLATAIRRLVELRLKAKPKVNWMSDTRVLVCIIGALLFTLSFALWMQYY